MFLNHRVLDQTYEVVPELADWSTALGAGSAELLHCLYGPDAPLNCFFLVDGTLRTEVSKLFDLDIAPVAVTSLFEGAAAEEAGDASPWLVDLGNPDLAIPANRVFHHNFFAQHWPAGYSVIIQTDASMDTVRAHLRRFTQLRLAEDGRLLTFRFWDPRILRPFLWNVANDPLCSRRFGLTDDDVALHYLLPAIDGDGPLRVSPAEHLEQHPVRAMHLTYADFSGVEDQKEKERHGRMVARLKEDFADELSDQPDVTVQKAVADALRHYGSYGFRSQPSLHFLAAWSVFYGVGFEQRDETGKLDAILQSEASEKEKFKAFRERVKSLPLAQERTG